MSAETLSGFSVKESKVQPPFPTVTRFTRKPHAYSDVAEKFVVSFPGENHVSFRGDVAADIMELVAEHQAAGSDLWLETLIQQVYAPGKRAYSGSGDINRRAVGAISGLNKRLATYGWKISIIEKIGKEENGTLTLGKVIFYEQIESQK